MRGREDGSDGSSIFPPSHYLLLPSFLSLSLTVLIPVFTYYFFFYNAIPSPLYVNALSTQQSISFPFLPPPRQAHVYTTQHLFLVRTPNIFSSTCHYPCLHLSLISSFIAIFSLLGYSSLSSFLFFIERLLPISSLAIIVTTLFGVRGE